MFAANNFFPDTTRLHVNDTHHVLKRRREQSAKRIAMKRLEKSKPKAINRKYDAQVTNCIFLDETRTVVSFDTRGYVSFIRCNAYNAEPLASISVISQSRMFRDTTPALFSVDNGNALVAGFGSGELRVFATESSTSFKFSTKALEPSNTTTYLGRTLRSWVARRPLRRYDLVPGCSLHSQLCDPYKYALNTTDEIHDWSNAAAAATISPPPRKDSPRVGWDVREMPWLQAVHVGQHKDMFALRIMDGRSTGHHIAIDLLDRGGDYYDVCFVSDYLLASSETNGTVKLWDIRRLQTPRQDQTVASFPKDNALGVSALHSFHCGAAKLVMLDMGKLLAVSDSRISVLDPFRRKLENTVKECKKSDHNILAIDRKHGLIARAGIGDTVELREALPFLRSRKRKVDPVHDGISVEASLEDSYGCATEMNCLAFNSSGSRLVCGTTDGDLYVW